MSYPRNIFLPMVTVPLSDMAPGTSLTLGGPPHWPIYVHVGSMAVLIWDILDNLRNDFRLVVSYNPGIQGALYFITRFTILGYSIILAVVFTAPVGNCAILGHVLNCLLITFTSSTTLLFYIRVFAVYNTNRIAAALFGIPALTSVALSINFYRAFSVVQLGQTNYCVETVRHTHSLLTPVAVFFTIYDLLNYFAITWRVYRMFLDCSGKPAKQTFKTLGFGNSLPLLARALLLDSQLYCLIILCSRGVVIFTLSVFEPPISVTFITCHLVLVNILSGRMYRKIKLGRDDQADARYVLSTLNFEAPSTEGVDSGDQQKNQSRQEVLSLDSPSAAPHMV